MTGSWTTIYGHGIMTVQAARCTICIHLGTSVSV